DRCAEALADALLESGALSVSTEDAHADTPDEQPLYGEPGFEPTRPAWARSRLRVLAEPDRADAIVEAAGLAMMMALAVEQRTAVEDADWVRATQSQFRPTRISEQLWIVPTWHQPPQPDAIVVRLDPGVAFGTGTHPTTRLCLAWLDANLPSGASVLDYGCGSGILAIAAAKLGAGTVIGTDIDPQALAAARANASANGVAAGYTDPYGLSQSAATFDIVLANILSNPLKLLAPALLARVAPGGSLVLSGILERQAEDVIATYRHADPTLPLGAWRTEDGWVCLVGTCTPGAQD
ncbi:MAG TPA: 50S ribosomal protein L11 methyltransferase, partial [Burkholderiaceae bacterium]|nr:50S ribosomal protein L11 methyltransferase [Burkholderiaceae bacterium]